MTMVYNIYILVLHCDNDVGFPLLSGWLRPAGGRGFLQIWNQCDAEGNFASHKKYKQEYTLWEKENREGGIVDG